jgi:hypothetical protein
MANKEDEIMKGLMEAIKSGKDTDPGMTPRRDGRSSFFGDDPGMTLMNRADREDIDFKKLLFNKLLNRDAPRSSTSTKKKPSNPYQLKNGGKVSSASSRADGIAQRGKTRGKMR